MTHSSNTITDANPDPFDVSALRLRQDFESSVGVEKPLLRVPVRKPNRQEFIRVHPGEDYRLDTAILELKEDREYYLVAPALRPELLTEAVPVRLYATISRAGIVALWPCRLPLPDGRRNAWHESALEAAGLATERWIRLAANMALGAYDVHLAAADLPAPTWPDVSFQELIKIAFKEAMIDRVDHPVLRRLRGEA